MTRLPLALAFLALVGCAQDAQHAAEACKHGPHGGNLIDLPNDTKAEVTADRDQGTITFHFLDAAGKEPQPIPVQKPVVALNGITEPVPLIPKPSESDPDCCYEGKLPDATRGRRLSGTLRITIAGKEHLIPFRHCPACTH